MDSGWTSDGWILRSIAATGSTLRGVIGVADYLNHAIPTEEEFTGAVGRLVAAGLAGCDPAADRYWLTPAGQASPAVLPVLPPAPPLTLPPGVFAAAVRAYLG